MPDRFSGRIGVALGSGAARGWAHLGALRALLAAGIVPDVVCGASAGAIVGAVFCADALDPFEKWGRQLDRREVVGLLDWSLRGGVVRAERAIEQVAAFLPERIEDLPRRFAAVATDLESGREIWLQEGPLLPALRASSAMPGFVAPVERDGRWLVDGGVVDPVPVSLCRALGADHVIGIDLNTTMLRRRFKGNAVDAPDRPEGGDGASSALQGLVDDLRRRFGTREEPDAPGLVDVVSNVIDIMQVRITRSRMAGDPPELLITPRLGDFGLLDFDRAPEAIAEGRRATEWALAVARLD